MHFLLNNWELLPGKTSHGTTENAPVGTVAQHFTAAKSITLASPPRLFLNRGSMTRLLVQIEDLRKRSPACTYTYKYVLCVFAKFHYSAPFSCVLIIIRKGKEHFMQMSKFMVIMSSNVRGIIFAIFPAGEIINLT